MTMSRTPPGSVTRSTVARARTGSPGVLDSLGDQLTVLDQRAADLAKARELLRQTIAATENATTPSPRPVDPGGPPPQETARYHSG